MKQWGDWFTPLKFSEHVLCTRPYEESHTEASSQSLNADDLLRERRQTVTQHTTESFRQLSALRGQRACSKATRFSKQKYRTASSINDAGKTDSYISKNEIRTLPNTIHKDKLKWIKDLNVRPETIKLLEENIGRTLHDINQNKILFDPPPRVTEIKQK